MIGPDEWHDLNTFCQLLVTCQTCGSTVARVVHFIHARRVGLHVGKGRRFVFLTFLSLNVLFPHLLMIIKSLCASVFRVHRTSLLLIVATRPIFDSIRSYVSLG